MHKFVTTAGLKLAFFSNVLTAFGQESVTQLHSDGAAGGHAHVAWESRYFSEGRDALSGDSLFVSSFELGWNHLAGEVWYGYSPDQRYDELHLTLGLTRSIGDFEFYGGYTHLRFPFDGSHDNELGAGVAWSGPLLEFAADFYYSFEADGYFVEISASRDFVITEQLSLSLSSPFGINQGYVAEGHDGVNHVAIIVGLEYTLTDSISLTTHATQSWALNKDPALSGDDQLIDFFHCGAGFQWRF